MHFLPICRVVTAVYRNKVMFIIGLGLTRLHSCLSYLSSFIWFVSIFEDKPIENVRRILL